MQWRAEVTGNQDHSIWCSRSATDGYPRSKCTCISRYQALGWV